MESARRPGNGRAGENDRGPIMSWISDWFHRPASAASAASGAEGAPATTAAPSTTNGALAAPSPATMPGRADGRPRTALPDLPRLRLGPGDGRPAAGGGTRHLEELQVVVLKLSGLRCSLQVPDDGPPFLSVCRAEAVRMRQTVWCEPAPLPADVTADGTTSCCSPSSTDTSCGFVWELGAIAPAHEVFEAAIVIINAMTAAPPSGGPVLA